MARSARNHGFSGTRLYSIWLNMKARCNRLSSNVYRYYGGRGISIYEKWLSNFMTFRQWAIENGYQDHLELERINVDGNYEPNNCRWATHQEQMCNTRKRCDAATSKFKGVSRHSQNPKWIAQATLNGKGKNLGSFNTQLEAALAYDDFIFATRGSFAKLNFPERKECQKNNRRVTDAVL